jgi:hypothetical protein
VFGDLFAEFDHSGGVFLGEVTTGTLTNIESAGDMGHRILDPEMEALRISKLGWKLLMIYGQLHYDKYVAALNPARKGLEKIVSFAPTPRGIQISGRHDNQQHRGLPDSTEDLIAQGEVFVDLIIHPASELFASQAMSHFPHQPLNEGIHPSHLMAYSRHIVLVGIADEHIVFETGHHCHVSLLSFPSQRIVITLSHNVGRVIFAFTGMDRAWSRVDDIPCQDDRQGKGQQLQLESLFWLFSSHCLVGASQLLGVIKGAGIRPVLDVLNAWK